MTPDGNTVTNRVDTTTERNLARKVVDNVLTSSSWMSRHMGQGAKMSGKTEDITIKVTDSGLGQFYSGLETLSSQASDNTVTLSYSHTAFAQPIVDVMLEAFANQGPDGTINLSEHKMDEAVAEAVQALGTASFGTGAGDQPLGLEALVDDGTNKSTIGGVTRSTYDLDSTVTASGGTLSLAKLATLHDAITAAGLANESPNISVTSKTIWSLYEELLQPMVTARYVDVGYQALRLRGNTILSSNAELAGHAGFNALSYRGKPVISDDKATSGVWYMLNERYIKWLGRTVVPAKYSDSIVPLTLGAKTMEGVGAEQRPPSSAGWFLQKSQMMPDQAGQLGRVHVIGQSIVTQPRRQGKLTGVTGV